MSGELTRRELLKWGLIGTSACVLAACAPKTPEVPAEKATEVPKAPAEPVVLSFWVNQPMARTEGLWDSLVADFQAKNPGIKMESLVIPHSDYEPKVLTGLAGGTVGDLLDVHPMHNATMALRGALLPLDDMMPSLGIPEEEMTKAWEYNVWRGKRWAIPRSDNPCIIMYNRKMVQDVGLPDPVDLWEQDKWNIDAFDTMMEAVSRGEGEDRIYGCTLLGGGSIRVQCVWLWGNDATVWNEDETKCVANSPEAVEAWDYMTGTIRKGWAPTPAEQNIPGNWVALLGQRRLVAQTTGAQFVLGGQAQFVPEDVMKEMQLVPLNTLWNGKREVRNATNSQGIYKESKHTDEAWKWMEFIVSEPAQAKILANRWSSPLVKSHAKSDAWLKSLDPGLETAEIWEDSFNNIRAFSHLPRMQEMEQFFQAAKDKMILGVATPQEAMDEAVAKINPIIEEVNVEVAEAGL